MFRGDRINVSENRSVLHVAIRMPKGTALALSARGRAELDVLAHL
jgi:glucose-6-phosphate isomerase